MKQASADPTTLSQETIVENLDPVEAARLSRVRNIGIAVSLGLLNTHLQLFILEGEC